MKTVTPVEKAYPEASRLARKFHNIYEEMAPSFGYKTRRDTTEFEPNSPNGRLMMYVCYQIVAEEIEKREAILREKIKELGHQQEDNTIWCNMDDMLDLLKDQSK